MSEAKFATEDKVFAKVKGYPSWPARITDYNSKTKRYEVKFYGTGETGTIKEEDIKYYLQYKEQLTANVKRKDFIEAINEIEKDIRKTKSDGNDVKSEDDSVLKKEIVENSPRKRKSIASESEIIQTPKKLAGKRKTVSIDKNETSAESSTSKLVEAPSDDETIAEPKLKVILENTELSKSKIEIEDEPKDKVEDDASVSVESPPKSRRGRKIKAKRLSIEEEAPKKVKIQKSPKINKTSINQVVKVELEDCGHIVADSTTEAVVDYSVVPIENLQILVKYFDAIRDKEQIFKKRVPEDLFPIKKPQVILAVAPSNIILGVYYHKKAMPKFTSEFHRASYEAEEAKRVLKLKAEIETGEKTLREVEELSVTLEGKNTEYQRNCILEDSLSYKQNKLKFLKIENVMLKCDCTIKKSLGLLKADTLTAVGTLETMFDIPVEPLMLKKHPQVFETVKKLQQYIGNVPDWKMSDEEVEKFEESAKEIRKLANQVFLKFMTTMLKILPSRDQINDTIFWTIYMEEVEKFQRETSNNSVNEVFAMHSEPYSRATILESIYEKEDIITYKSITDTSTVLDPRYNTFAITMKTD